MEQARKVRETFLSRSAAKRAELERAADALIGHDISRPPVHTDTMREYAAEFRLLT
jgi:hypothetical protein